MYLRAFRTYKSVVMYSYISEHSELTSQWLCTHVSQSSQNLQVSSYVLMYLRAVRTYKSVVMYFGYLRAFRNYKSVIMYSCTHAHRLAQAHECCCCCCCSRSRSRSHSRSHSRARSHYRSCSCCFVDSTCHQPVMAASSLQELSAMRYLTTCELDKMRHLVTDVRFIKRRMASSTCLVTRCRPDVDLFMLTHSLHS